MRKLLLSMESGEWHEPPFTFDSIAFDKQNRLCNGLHRMAALAQYDKPLCFIVLLGVESPGNMPLPEGDSGSKRFDFFVAGEDMHDWAAVRFLADCAIGHEGASRSYVQSIFPLFADALAALPTTIKPRPAAPVRAAFVFQWTANRDSIYRQALADQWDAFCRMEVTRMWSSMGQLYRNTRISSRGGKDRSIQFVSASYAIEHPSAMRLQRESDVYATVVKNWILDNAKH